MDGTGFVAGGCSWHGREKRLQVCRGQGRAMHGRIMMGSESTMRREEVKDLKTSEVRWRPAVRLFLAAAHRVSRRSALFRRRHGGLVKLAKMSILMPLMLAMVNTPAVGPLAAAGGPWRAFTSAFGVVFVSEFGDKSMFATALMAMRYNPVLVLFGALAALTAMTIIACFLGQLGQFLHPQVTYYASIALFAFFGLQMLLQAKDLPSKPGSGGESESAKEMVSNIGGESSAGGGILARVISLIFVAEWLDRSMLATMALAAAGGKLLSSLLILTWIPRLYVVFLCGFPAYPLLGNTGLVFLGATFANIVCTGIAVAGAAVVATRISERTIAIIAGILFEVFAVYTYFEPSFESD